MTKNILAELEHIIETNQCRFYQIGKALMRIRDERLYRELFFFSFEAYVTDRWDMARSQAYRLMEASKVIDNLSPIGDGILPQNESQARALAQLKAADQRNIWREFIESATPMSASNIRKFIKMRGKKGGVRIEPDPVNLVDIISAGYKAAVMAMLEQIRLAKNDHWQNTSRQASLYWLRVMKETIMSTLHQDKAP
jgi:hypothetical protein